MPSGKGIRAGRAFVELFADDTRLARGLKRASARMRAFGGSVRAAGIGLIGLGAAVVAPLIAATRHFASAGDQIQKMADRTGISAETLSQLGFAAEQGGASIDQLDKSLAAMARFVLQVDRGLATAKDTMRDLGLEVDALEGLSPEEKFFALADAISRVEDPTKRAGLALTVFGRGGRELLPMLNGGREGINKLRAEADALGLTMSGESTQAAAELTDSMNRLWRVVKAGVFHIGAALAPTLMSLLKVITGVTVGIIGWVKENPRLIQTVFKVGAAVLFAGVALVALGATIIGIGAVLSGLVTIIGAVGTVLAAIVSPVGLTIAAIAALAIWLLKTTAAGSVLTDIFGEMAGEFATAFEAIKAALSGGDIGAAFNVLRATIQLQWQKGITFLETRWLQFKSLFLDTLTVIQGEAAKIFADIFGNITKGIILASTEASRIALKSILEFKARVAELQGNETAARGFRAAQSGIDAGINLQQQDQLAQAERNRLGAAGEIDADTQRQIDARTRQTEREIAEARAELERAKAEFDSANAEAIAAGEEGGGVGERLQGLLDLLSGAGGAVQTRFQANRGGTFSSLAARQFGAGRSTAEKTLEATEAIADNTAKILSQGGLTFAD